MLDAHDQVMRLLVDFHHGRDMLAIGVEQRDVVLDEQLHGRSHELLLFACLFKIMVAGRDSHLVFEGAIKVVIALDQLADQCGVAGPDHGAVRRIDIGQQHVRQVRDMVKEFTARLAPGFGIDIRQRRAIGARVKQLAHGAHIGD
ncbi:hypothetical protein D3C80_1519050 [compost metagenome]